MFQLSNRARALPAAPALPRAVPPEELSAPPPSPRWVRIRVNVELALAAPQRLITLDRGPRSLRVTVALPQRWAVGLLIGVVLWVCGVLPALRPIGLLLAQLLKGAGG